MLLTHAHPWNRLFPERIAVESGEVLQAGDGVDRVEPGVDVDSVDWDLALPFVHLLVVEGVGRELEGIFGAGEVAVIVDCADWYI